MGALLLQSRATRPESVFALKGKSLRSRQQAGTCMWPPGGCCSISLLEPWERPWPCRPQQQQQLAGRTSRPRTGPRTDLQGWAGLPQHDSLPQSCLSTHEAPWHPHESYAERPRTPQRQESTVLLLVQAAGLEDCCRARPHFPRLPCRGAFRKESIECTVFKEGV